MISKTEFCDIIKAIMDRCNYQKELDDVCRKHGVDGYFPYVDSDSDVVWLLDHYAIPNDGDWVSYFCWEGDFGKDLTPDSVSIDDKNIDITTPEKLYDFLIKYCTKRKN